MYQRIVSREQGESTSIRGDNTFTNEHRKFFLSSEKEYRIPPFFIRCSPYQRTIFFTFEVIERIKAPQAYG